LELQCFKKVRTRGTGRKWVLVQKMKGPSSPVYQPWTQGHRPEMEHFKNACISNVCSWNILKILVFQTFAVETFYNCLYFKRLQLKHFKNACISSVCSWKFYNCFKNALKMLVYQTFAYEAFVKCLYFKRLHSKHLVKICF